MQYSNDDLVDMINKDGIIDVLDFVDDSEIEDDDTYHIWTDVRLAIVELKNHLGII